MKNDITHIFEETYERESDAVFRFAVLRVSDRQEAIDITEETFVRFWTTLRSGEAIGNPRAFLFTVVRRLIIDWYRKKKSISLDRIAEEESETGSSILDREATDMADLGAEGRYLMEKIRDLPPHSRDPVYLRFVEDVSPKEIARILGISENAASVRINRGLDMLRKNTGYDKEH